MAAAVGTAMAAAVAVGAGAVESHHDGAQTGGAAARAAGAGKTSGDINGDGCADLGSGAPGATVGGHAKAGYVAVTNGSVNGVDIDAKTQLTQASKGVPGTPESGDKFGSSVAIGDVDGDGYADLVVAASGEAIGSTKHAGSVTVAFGGKNGLSGKAIAFHAPKPSAEGRFGDELTLGDFNHDGRQDIAVADGPKVDLVYGARDLSAATTPEIGSVSPPGSAAGVENVSSGDVNGDGYADLVTTASEDDPADEGTLGVLGGSEKGVRSSPLGKTVGLPFASYDPVVGDINGDGKDDVVIDTGFEDGPDEYKLRTYPGAGGGLDTGDPVDWKGDKQPGTAAALADFNGDGHDDLVVTDTDADDSDGISGAGALTVLKGGKDWLTDSGAQKFSLDTKGVAGVAEGGDKFGSALAPADYNGDKVADLAVGVPGKHDSQGATSMLYAGKQGLGPENSILFGPDSLGYPKSSAAFGTALTVPAAD